MTNPAPGNPTDERATSAVAGSGKVEPLKARAEKVEEGNARAGNTGAGNTGPESPKPNSPASKAAPGWRGRPPGLPGGVPPPSVPLAFLLASALGLVATGIAFIAARGAGIPDPTADPVVAATHFGVLASLAMGVLGAMHQFTPVITGRPLRSIGLARATFACWMAAAWMLPLGVWTEQVGVAAASGAAAALAIALVCVNFGPALCARGKGTPVLGLRLAIAGAIVTACLGALFVGDRQGHWFALPGHVDCAMAVVGLFGWLGTTYVAVAEKLWPMFFLAHVPDRRRSGRVAVIALGIGTTVLAIGLAAGPTALAWSGGVIVGVGLGAHLVSLCNHLRHRRRGTDLHLVFVGTSALWLVAAAGLALASAIEVPGNEAMGMALGASAVTAAAGWLLTALVGHAHKIVPFILWTAIRARGVERHRSGRALLFADLYGHRLAAVSYGLVTAGIAGLCVGFAASASAATAIGGFLLSSTGVLVAANLAVIPLRMLRSPAG